MTTNEIRQVMNETVTELSSCCLGHRANPQIVEDEEQFVVDNLERWADRRFGDDRSFRRDWIL